MKKLILLFAALQFIACSNNLEKHIEEATITYLQENNEDPKSYEPVETFPIDTIYTQDFVQKKISDYEHDLKGCQENLNYTKKEMEANTSQGKDFDEYLKRNFDYNTRCVDTHKTNIEILKTVTDNAIEFYVYEHRYRLNNRYGGADMRRIKVLTDPDMNVLFVHRSEVEGKASGLFNQKHNIKVFVP